MASSRHFSLYLLPPPSPLLFFSFPLKKAELLLVFVPSLYNMCGNINTFYGM